MEKRADIIRGWIKDRKERGETTKCMFYITVPKCEENIMENPVMKKVEGIFEKYHIPCNWPVDTVCGAWNLNRDWMETGEVECIVEFCGVYPADWDAEDAAELERMDTEGEIIMMVDWIQDGKHIPNH